MPQMRLQVIVTQRCNAVCDYCDKAVGLVKISDMDMTEEMMREAARRCVRDNMKVRRITLSGGEPILNVELQGIIDACLDFPEMAKVRVLTNDMNVSREARSKINLPDERFHWVPSPIDDLDDPYSGKNLIDNDRVKNRIHHPFWISPDDLGMEASFKKCTIKWRCGRGVDAAGFSMCGQAGIMGRILGIDPYEHDPDASVKDHVLKPIDEICKHCKYGLNKAEGKQFIRDTKDGTIPPEISPTWQAAIDKFQDEPQTYDIGLMPQELPQGTVDAIA